MMNDTRARTQRSETAVYGTRESSSLRPKGRLPDTPERKPSANSLPAYLYYLGKVVKERTVPLARTLRTTSSMVPAMLPAQPLVTCKSWSHEPAALAHSS